MAAVRIEAAAFLDRRFDVLAQFLGLPDADCARGKMATLWRQCTAELSYVLSPSIVASILGASGPDALIKSGLGARSRGGIRIKGTKGRIEWLQKLRNNGRKGGRPTKSNSEPNGFDTETNTETRTEPPPNPPTLILTPTLIPTDQTPKVPRGDLSDQNHLVIPVIPKRPGRPRKAKPNEPTPAELESVQTILGKLGNHTGVNYSGAAEHTRLITSRLREGLDEMDLRKVVHYCAHKLDWASDEKMRSYLRPETLFGPRTIARYLDAARAWFATLPEEAAS